MKTIKRIETIGGVLLLLIVASVVLIPQAYAKSEYATALQNEYGRGTCLDCHTGPNGGKSLTTYGNSFKAQPGYKSNTAAAVQAIGQPPGGVPDVTDTVVETPSGTVTNTVVETPSETPSETPTAVVTQTTVASQTTVKPDTTKKVEPGEKDEENEEKEETKESPGLDIIAIIGIISIVYILRRYRL